MIIPIPSYKKRHFFNSIISFTAADTQTSNKHIITNHDQAIQEWSSRRERAAPDRWISMGGAADVAVQTVKTMTAGTY
jgi:hypothetical protein